MAPKSIFSSKTFWLNLIGLVLMIFTATEVTGIIPPEWLKYEAALVAILNIVNRFFTSQPVSVLGERGTTQLALTGAITLFLTLAIAPTPSHAAGHHPCLNASDSGACVVWVADVHGERYTGAIEDLTPDRHSDAQEAKIEAAYAYHAAHMAQHPTEYRTGVNGPDGFDLGISSVHPPDVTLVSLRGSP